MKNFKLKKFLTFMTLALVTTLAIAPIKASAAWKQDSNGWWNTEGSSWSTGWGNIDNNWYYFGSDGYMKTGWVNDGGKWYYTTSSGAMQTGWLSNNGVWYYLSTSGDMKTGLVEVNNKAYYFSESGAMKTGNVTVNGQAYTFAANGEKIDLTVAKPTTADSTTTDLTTSSGGSGGGSSSSSDSTTTSSTTYESLYGTWTVGDYMGSTSATVDEEKINSYIGKQFEISEDGLTYSGFTGVPSVKESSMPTSAFNSKWGTDIDSTNVTCFSISYLSKKVTVYVTDGNTYASLDKYLFELN